MNLLRATGMLSPPADGEITENPTAWERLVEEAVAFRRAGGVLTLADWADATGAERGAFVEAYRIVEAERAAAVGLASLGVDMAARVAAPSDGGKAEAGLGMDRALARVVARSQAAGGGVP